MAGTAGQVKDHIRPDGDCGYPNRRLCTPYSYDALARVASMTDGRGKVTRYSYDGWDRGWR